jgi:hypothetical protein
VVRHIFQACPVWIYTQSNITSIILNNIVTPDSGSTILFDIVDTCEQRGQQPFLLSSGLGVFCRVYSYLA